jgi:hypothetical protein
MEKIIPVTAMQVGLETIAKPKSTRVQVCHVEMEIVEQMDVHTPADAIKASMGLTAKAELTHVQVCHVEMEIVEQMDLRTPAVVIKASKGLTAEAEQTHVLWVLAKTEVHASVRETRTLARVMECSLVQHVDSGASMW